MEITQARALEIIGSQQVELVVLRERVALLGQHRCEPCQREHVDEPGKQESGE